MSTEATFNEHMGASNLICTPWCEVSVGRLLSATPLLIALVLAAPASAQVLEVGDGGVVREVGPGWAPVSAPVAVAARPFAADLAAAAAAYDLSPDLLDALVRSESGYDPKARSAAGAIGLTQLMPATAAALGVDPWDPSQNLMGGAAYLRAQLDRFDGAVDLALAAYNAGPTRVARAGGVPAIAETQTYVGRNLERLADHVLPSSR